MRPLPAAIRGVGLYSLDCVGGVGHLEGWGGGGTAVWEVVLPL